MKKRRALFICGSAARMLSSNYFQRKVVPNLNRFCKIYLVTDSYIFHDKKENRVILSSEHILKKSAMSNYEWENFLYRTLNEYNKILNISKVKKWTAFNCSILKLKHFLFKIDDKRLQIDILDCPFCHSFHKGPFEIVKSGRIKLPCTQKACSFFSLKKKDFRLKKGFLQLYLVFLKKRYVFVSEDFIKDNLFLIRKFKREDFFEIQGVQNYKKQDKFLDDYISNFKVSKISVENGKEFIYYTKKLGIYIGSLHFIREFFRKKSWYRFSDIVRNMLSDNNIYINDEGKTSTIIIKRRVL